MYYNTHQGSAMKNNPFYTQVSIIGAGVSGSALLFVLARYTDVASVALFEKCNEPATLNSSAKANSQTLHLGDIETNYDLQKATHVKSSSSMVANFITHFDFEEEIGYRRNKMILAVGDQEISRLKERYHTFKELFPSMRLWDEKMLAEKEPSLLRERTQKVMAIGVEDQITTVDFHKLSQTFITLAQEEKSTLSTLHFENGIESISKKGDKYLLRTLQGEHLSDIVIVNAGAHSLVFAHQMGYGQAYAMLPIGGGFYFADDVLLKSKVYTMQHPKLPFAAVHADPDFTNGWKTRFGPTAFATPKLENRHHFEILNLFDVLSLDKSVLEVYYDLMKDEDIRNYILENFAYQLPGFGNNFFISEVQKIIPSLQSEQIHYADGYGGIRPQIIDKINKRLLLGEAKIDTGDGIVFNMTPSPGASSCLGNAYEDAQRICKILDLEMDKRLLIEELCEQSCIVTRETLK